MKPQPEKQHILDSLLAIAKGAGRAPSRSEFLSLSGISEHSVSQFFPSWNDAVRAAGLRPYMINVRLKDSELLKDWAYAVRSNGKIPARRAYRHLGQYDHRTFERRFGPWSTLPEVFRKFAQDNPEWADVVTLLPVPKPKPVRKPATEPAQNPTHNSAPHFAHNNPARNGDGQPDHQPASSLPLSKLRHPPLEDRPTYGRAMDFRGLRHEPVNEQSVVLLFGMVAKDLGYIVEAVQSGFPDCEATATRSPAAT